MCLTKLFGRSYPSPVGIESKCSPVRLLWTSDEKWSVKLLVVV